MLVFFVNIDISSLELDTDVSWLLFCSWFDSIFTDKTLQSIHSLTEKILPDDMWRDMWWNDKEQSFQRVF